MRAISWTRFYEDKGSSSKMITLGPQTYRPPHHPQINSSSSHLPPRTTLSTLLPTPTQRLVAPTTRPPIKRLTMVEQQMRRENSLCFWCEEKFTPQHKCSNKQFMLYQIEKDDSKQGDLLASEQIEDEELHQLES